MGRHPRDRPRPHRLDPDRPARSPAPDPKAEGRVRPETREGEKIGKVGSRKAPEFDVYSSSGPRSLSAPPPPPRDLGSRRVSRAMLATATTTATTATTIDAYNRPVSELIDDWAVASWTFVWSRV